MKHFGQLAAVVMLGTSVLLGGCNGSSSSSTGSAANNANLNLYVSDTPMDSAAHVNIVFTGVQIQGGYANGMMGSGTTTPITFNFASPKNIDLMAQQGGNSAALLMNAAIPAGHYQWVRLMVDPAQCTITLSDGSVHPLVIPSGAQTGLKLVSGFDVATGGSTDFTIDFNLRQAVTMSHGGYMMRPAMRMMNNIQVGSLNGSVSNTFTIGTTAISDPACSPAVYIYSGSGVTPVDINTTSTIQPVTTESLTLNNTTGNYDYKAGFLATGSYTLAVTCAAADDPSTADSLTFSATKTATVSSNQTTTVNFP